MIRELVERVLMHVFLWSGSKLFAGVDVYSPDGVDGEVVGLTFSNDPLYLNAVSDVEVYHAPRNGGEA